MKSSASFQRVQNRKFSLSLWLMWDECEWIQIHLLWLRAQMCDGKTREMVKIAQKLSMRDEWVRLWGLQVPCFAVGGQLTVHKMSLTIWSLIVEMGPAVVDARLCEREKDEIMEKTRQILITEMEIFLHSRTKKNVDNVERVSLGYVRVLWWTHLAENISSTMKGILGSPSYSPATWCVTRGNRIASNVWSCSRSKIQIQSHKNLSRNSRKYSTNEE